MSLYRPFRSHVEAFICETRWHTWRWRTDCRRSVRSPGEWSRPRPSQCPTGFRPKMTFIPQIGGRHRWIARTTVSLNHPSIPPNSLCSPQYLPFSPTFRPSQCPTGFWPSSSRPPPRQPPGRSGSRPGRKTTSHHRCTSWSYWHPSRWTEDRPGTRSRPSSSRHCPSTECTSWRQSWGMVGVVYSVVIVWRSWGLRYCCLWWFDCYFSIVVKVSKLPEKWSWSNWSSSSCASG